MVGSCGETSETKAALMHALVAFLYTALFICEGVMVWWHWTSIKTHLDRARLQ